MEKKEEEEGGGGGEEQSTCVFIKPRKPRGKLRKRGVSELQEEGGGEEETGSAVIRKKKNDSGVALGGTTKVREKVSSHELYQSTGDAMLGAESKSTAAIESETDFSQDAVSIEDRHRELQEILNGEDAENAEKVYRGLSGYKDWIETKKLSGLSKGTGIKAGPVRALLNIRTSALFDYQPDVCKDYKETGYCGYGDSCKFMHDRTDYKSGWQMEQEWEEEKNRKVLSVQESYEVEEDEEDDNIPFACSICRQGFVNPVSTRCKHYFCERCALHSFKKNMKCAICGENTYGTFTMVPEKIREKMIKKREMALEKGDFTAQGENEDETE